MTKLIFKNNYIVLVLEQAIKTFKLIIIEEPIPINICEALCHLFNVKVKDII